MAHVYDPSTGRVEFSKNTPAYTSKGWVKLTDPILVPLIGPLPVPPNDREVQASITRTLPYWLWDAPSSTISLMTRAEQDQANADKAASDLNRAKNAAYSDIDEVTVLAQQILVIAGKTSVQITGDGQSEKDTVAAMTDLADVLAYTDPRITRGSF